MARLIQSKEALGPPNLYARRGFGRCICGKHMFEKLNQVSCLWCGHGPISTVAEDAYRRNMEMNFGIRTTPEPDVRVVPLKKPRGSWDQDSCVAAYWAWKANHGGVAPTSNAWQRPLDPGEGKRPCYGTVRKLFGSWTAFKQYIAEIPRDQALVTPDAVYRETA